MIQAKELRTGNIVLINGLRTLVDVLVINHLVEKDIQFTVEGLKFSEEILLNCGFYKLNHLGRNEFVLYINESLSVEYIQDYGIRIVLSNENEDLNVNLSSYVCYYDKTDIKYLHQLQNLYFSLTGSELDTSKLFECTA